MAETWRMRLRLSPIRSLFHLSCANSKAETFPEANPSAKPWDELNKDFRFSPEVSFQPIGGQFSRRRAQLDNPIQNVLNCLDFLGYQLSKDPIFKRLEDRYGDLEQLYAKFRRRLEKQLNGTFAHKDKTVARLLAPAVSGKEIALPLRLKCAFFDYVFAELSPDMKPQNLEDIADMRYPVEWFPATRAYQREIHVHVGPTNSGKTYQALKRLEASKTGVYAGPLRLLAHEVYMRLNAKGHRCNLVTGDDRRTADTDPTAPKISCTVEMLPLNTTFDVAVIDEIQMLGSADRGWAWTQALLGVMAKEVHLCGEERSVPIIRELAAICGEPVHVHEYKRLSPLNLAAKSLDGNLYDLRKGDCIVGFSIVVLHSVRQLIEKTLNKKCAIIYGSLPPETRAQQAALFNDPDNDYDFLVASNAVGMGLNLAIKRLVFQTLARKLGGKLESISVPEIKQIAGRAGRYSIATEDTKRGSQAQESPSGTNPRPAKKQSGSVTTLESYDFPMLASAMKSNPEPIRSAGLFPASYIVERFARCFPSDTPFTYLLLRLNDIADTGSRFFLSDMGQNLAIADEIESVRGLSVKDRLVMCSAPIEPRKPGEGDLARAYARCIAECQGKSVLDFQELEIEWLEDDYTVSIKYLEKLERLHRGIILFMWLSWRFTGIFLDRHLATHVKELVEKRIEDTLAQLSFDYEKLRKGREQAILDLLGPEEDHEKKAQQDSDPLNFLPRVNDLRPASGVKGTAYGLSDGPLQDRLDHKLGKAASQDSAVPDDEDDEHQATGPLAIDTGVEDPSFYEDGSLEYDCEVSEENESHEMKGTTAIEGSRQSEPVQRSTRPAREPADLEEETETTLRQPDGPAERDTSRQNPAPHEVDSRTTERQNHAAAR